MTLDTQLTWTAHINQMGRKTAQRLSMAGTLLNRKSGLSIRNSMLLYKQLVSPKTDYAPYGSQLLTAMSEVASVSAL
jgi:hypothetical protein